MSVIKLTGIGKKVHVTDMTSTDVDPKTGFTILTPTPGTPLLQQITTIATIAELTGNLDFNAFVLNSSLNIKRYYIYFTVDGVKKDPRFVDRIGIEVKISSGETANDNATILQGIINALPEFTATVLTNTVTVTNVDVGASDNAYDGYGYDLSGIANLEVFKIEGYVWGYHTRTQSTGNRIINVPTKEWVCFRIARDKFEWVSP